MKNAMFSKPLVRITLCLFVIVLYLFYRFFLITNNDFEKASEFLQVDIPPTAEVIFSYDTHARDGEYYVIFELNKSSKKQFLDAISDDKRWSSLPISADIESLKNLWVYGKLQRQNPLPVDAKNGIYFFHDRQPELYPDAEETKLPVWARSSFNFVLAILDLNVQRLYVLVEDT